MSDDLTIRRAMECAPSLIREVYSTGPFLKELSVQHHYFLAGAIIWRVREEAGVFTKEERRGVIRHPGHSFFYSLFHEYLMLGFTYEELDQADKRGLNPRLLHFLVGVGKEKERIAEYLLLPSKEIMRLMGLYQRQTSTYRFGPFFVSRDEVAFLEGLLSILERTYALTPRQALLLPFLVFKSVTEYSAKKRMKGLQGLLADFNMSVRLASKIFPDLMWKQPGRDKLDNNLKILKKKVI